MEHTKTQQPPAPVGANADHPASGDLDLPKKSRTARGDLHIRTPADIIRRSVNVSDLRATRWWIPVVRAGGVHLAAITAIGATATLTNLSAAPGGVPAWQSRLGADIAISDQKWKR
jgi:hypothetical protein